MEAKKKEDTEMKATEKEDEEMKMKLHLILNSCLNYILWVRSTKYPNGYVQKIRTKRNKKKKKYFILRKYTSINGLS